jgi:hypothetical protein
MRLSGFVLLFCVSLLQSCGADVQSFGEASGFTQDQLQSGVALKTSSEGFEKIKRKREEAFALGHHFKGGKDYVKATLECRDEVVDVKIRLKGDELDHLAGDHWSYRVKTKDKMVMGHKKFSLQRADSKNYLLEWLFQKSCEREALLALDYFFVPLTMNDSLTRTYAFEGVADNQTLKNAGRTLGPIIKLDEKAYWKLVVAGEKRVDSASVIAAKIKVLNKKWSKESEVNSSLTAEAIYKLDGYRKGKLSADQVFDFETFSNYVAICELFGSSHSLRWINMRFYYNPSTQLLEPIAFDCYDGRHPRNEIIWYNEENRFEYFLHPLLDDVKFQSKVEEYLKVYCTRDYVKSIFSINHSDLAKYIKLIKRDKPNYTFSRSQMLKRAKYILGTLN